LRNGLRYFIFLKAKRKKRPKDFKLAPIAAEILYVPSRSLGTEHKVLQRKAGKWIKKSTIDLLKKKPF
jgi:hypothetical protein